MHLIEHQLKLCQSSWLEEFMHILLPISGVGHCMLYHYHTQQYKRDYQEEWYSESLHLVPNTKFTHD